MFFVQKLKKYESEMRRDWGLQVVGILIQKLQGFYLKVKHNVNHYFGALAHNILNLATKSITKLLSVEGIFYRDIPIFVNSIFVGK